jgi:hypothetical protein
VCGDARETKNRRKVTRSIDPLQPNQQVTSRNCCNIDCEKHTLDRCRVMTMTVLWSSSTRQIFDSGDLSDQSPSDRKPVAVIQI